MTPFRLGALWALVLSFASHALPAGNQLMGVYMPPAAQVQNFLHFASAGDPGEDAAKYCAIEKVNPQSDGLPIWGPSNHGVTVIVERKPFQQTGYYGGFPWWANKGDFGWDSGNPSGIYNSYWGTCPFPPGGFSGTTHTWELSGMGYGADNQLNLEFNTIAVIKSALYVQGLRIDYNGGDKQGIFYYNLPRIVDSTVIYGPPITSPSDAHDFGNTNPPSPTFRFGDSPWTDFLPIERGSSDLGRVKVFDTLLTEADMLSESGDLTRIVTAAGGRHIWWGKTNWRTVNDLTDDYGTGRTFTWADATYKGTLVPR